MTHALQEDVVVPVCPTCGSKHFPYESCKTKREDALRLCSLCVGSHDTKDCPVLDPAAAWVPPELVSKRRRRSGRRHRRGSQRNA